MARGIANLRVKVDIEGVVCCCNGNFSGQMDVLDGLREAITVCQRSTDSVLPLITKLPIVGRWLCDRPREREGEREKMVFSWTTSTDVHQLRTKESRRLLAPPICRPTGVCFEILSKDFRSPLFLCCRRVLFNQEFIEHFQEFQVIYAVRLIKKVLFSARFYLLLSEDQVQEEEEDLEQELSKKSKEFPIELLFQKKILFSNFGVFSSIQNFKQIFYNL